MSRSTKYFIFKGVSQPCRCLSSAKTCPWILKSAKLNVSCDIVLLNETVRRPAHPEFSVITSRILLDKHVPAASWSPACFLVSVGNGNASSVLQVTARTFTTGRNLQGGAGVDDDREKGGDNPVLVESWTDDSDPAFGSKENKGSGDGERPVYRPDPTEGPSTQDSNEDDLPPSNCCQSGCANCVWVDYVEKLTARYTDPEMSREKVLQELEQLEDLNIKAFIMMELRTKKLI